MAQVNPPPDGDVFPRSGTDLRVPGVLVRPCFLFVIITRPSMYHLSYTLLAANILIFLSYQNLAGNETALFLLPDLGSGSAGRRRP